MRHLTFNTLWASLLASVTAITAPVFGQATQASRSDPASVSSTTRAATTVIHAGHLISEPGKPVTTNQSSVIENGQIVAIEDGFVPGGTVIELKDSWVMPGLIDMHTHVNQPWHDP